STMAPTAADEANFMAQLLQGLDADFWTASPSPNPSPVKKQPLNHLPPPSPPSAFRTPTKPTHAKSLSQSQPVVIPSSTAFSTNEHDIAAFLEGSENWDLDTDPFTPLKPSAPKKSAEITVCLTQDLCTRCIAERVTEEYVDNRWRKVISILPSSSSFLFRFSSCWSFSRCKSHDIFNVIGAFSPASSWASTSSQTQIPKRSISITSQSNLLILHPDLLITATALSNAPQCRRKPLLSGLVRSTSDISPALVWGSMLHEVMQRCLLARQWEEAFIEKCIDEAVQGGLGELVKLGLSEEIARREVKERAKGLIFFADKYLANEPKSTAALTNTRSGAHDAPSLLAITDLLDIEEDIWSPTYGIKGKIDATVQGIISDPIPTPSAPNSSYSKPFQTQNAIFPPARTQTQTPLPLELKTGRALAGMEHRAQTMLYTLLLSERYGADVTDGLLFYTQSEGEVVRVPRGRNEVRGLLGVRNEVAAFMWRRVQASPRGTPGSQAPEQELADLEEHFLPAPIDDERTCKRCYALEACLLFRKTHPNHSLTPSPSLSISPKALKKALTTFDPPVPSFLTDAFAAKTAHLTPLRVDFFRKWERLLALEERDLVKFKRELWTLGAGERERRGRCFGGMVVGDGDGDENGSVPKDGTEWGKDGKIHRWTYAFERSKTWSLLNGHLGVGDAITVSVEPRLLALARGYILELSPERVVVGVDHVLDVGALKARVRTEIPQSQSYSQDLNSNSNSNSNDEELVFRIDKDELFGGMARVRNNLAQLFYADGDRKRLELVVDLRKPVFSPPTPPFLPPSPPSSHSRSSTPDHLQTLNPSQLHAMERVLSAEDYALVLGMPGTGKTTVVAALIRELVRRGKTVLLSSYTHSAVDTILRKLDGGGGGDFGILRLGNVDKVHPEVRKYTLSARRTPTTVEQLEKQLMDAPVVATTCLSVDQYTPEARQGGLEVSLFRRLSEAHPEAVVDLRFQYRMNQEIMLLSNRLIYDDRLRCGSDEVAKRALALADKRFLGRLHADHQIKQEQPRADGDAVREGCQAGGTCWLAQLADESCKAVFVDTDALPAHDSRVGDLVQNTTEAELVRQFTETLLQCGVQEAQIGIISLYRQQVKLLQHLLQARAGVEVLTADKSQGRDKDCVIVSLVRSNEEGHIGDLVKDWRRMNVSFTRARSKLVIFGSRKTLERDPLLAQFFGLMEGQGWVVRLPPGAHTAHARVFDVCSTPSKRDACEEEEVEVVEEKKKETETGGRPTKKMKLGSGKGKSAGAGAGVLKGRPILQDLVGNEA
ncbi:hypothetical protein GALMADRAFT_76567, partial [Galerina marginata CBS 339.88]